MSRSTRASWPGLRGRVLLSVVFYSFAQVSVVSGMRRQDYFGQGEPRVVEAPRERREAARRSAHHRPAAALDCVQAAGLEDVKAALFQSMDPAGAD